MPCFAVHDTRSDSDGRNILDSQRNTSGVSGQNRGSMPDVVKLVFKLLRVLSVSRRVEIGFEVILLQKSRNKIRKGREVRICRPEGAFHHVTFW